ncbi:TPA: recombinase family protein [Vibrio parahaemolyticus]
MKRAYSYIRFSTKGQIEGHSLDRQTESARNYAEKHGLELQDISYQDLGVSGYQGKNVREGALGQFIEAVKQGEIEEGSYLLMESFDRMSRLPVEKAMYLFLELINLGIVVVTLMDEHVYRTGNLDQMRLMGSIVSMSLAHEESLKKSNRLKKVWEKKKADAINKPTGSPLPAWLYYNEDKTDIFVYEAKALIVNYIFMLSAEGWGRISIVRRLNSEGVPPIGDRASRWHESYVTKLLVGRMVLGEYQPHGKDAAGNRVPVGDVIKGYYPQIVPEDLWLKAQAASQGRRNRSTGALRNGFTRNIFTGFVKCECGATMNFVHKGDTAKGGSYLVCSTARNGAGCNYVGHRYYRTQWVVLIALQKLLVPYTHRPDDTGRELSLEGEIIELRSSIEGLLPVLMATKSITVGQQIKDLENRVESIEKQLADIQNAKAVIEDVVDLTDLSAKINEHSERLKLHQYLKRQLDKIVVHKDRITIDIHVKHGDNIYLKYSDTQDTWSDGQGLTFIYNESGRFSS